MGGREFALTGQRPNVTYFLHVAGLAGFTCPTNLPQDGGIGGGPMNKGASSITNSAGCQLSIPVRQTSVFRPNDPSRTRAESEIRSNRSEERRVGKECRSRWS